MRRYFLVIVALIFLSIKGYSQTDKEAILGVWINEHKDSKVEFYLGADSLFYAKLLWVKKEKHQDRVGLIFIKEMKYDNQSGTWNTDYMYSPDYKMVAKGILSIKDCVLYVKGRKLGISATETFTRIE